MLHNDERRKQRRQTRADTHDSDACFLRTSKSRDQACKEQRPACDQSQRERVCPVVGDGHDRAPDSLGVNDDLITTSVHPRTQNDVAMEFQEISESAPSNDEISGRDDRHGNGADEYRHKNGAAGPANSAKHCSPKDGGTERQRDIDIRQLVQIGESADAARDNHHRGINLSVESKPNQNNQEQAVDETRK